MWKQHDFRFDLTSKKSCILLLHLQNYISWLRTHFLDLGLGWGLYIRYQDTAGALRSFLVLFSASRALWRGVYALGSICDMCSRDVLNPHIIETLIFPISIRHDVNLVDRTDPPGRKSSRQTTKPVQEWFLWVKSRSWWFFGTSRQQLYFFKTTTWL